MKFLILILATLLVLTGTYYYGKKTEQKGCVTGILYIGTRLLGPVPANQKEKVNNLIETLCTEALQ